jgi:hypothetical protein
MPNSLAHLVLYISPLVVVVLFRRLSLPQALIWSILGTYLFMPDRVNFNLPVLPNLDKYSLPSLTALVMVWLSLRKQKRLEQLAKARGAVSPPADADDTQIQEAGTGRGLTRERRVKRRGGRFLLILVAICVLAPIMTWYTNQSPTRSGGMTLREISLYDAMSLVQSTFIMLLPFLLARRVLNTPEASTQILKALVYGGLVYSLLILIELRMSPQLNKWLYGFYSHSFGQHVRDGGYRPMIFLKHGLRVGIFMSMTVLAALILYRMREGAKPGRWLIYAVWLFVILFLSKTLGAFLITLLLLPAALLFGIRTQLLVSAALAGIVLLYPIVRGSGLVPVDRITSAVSNISAGRAGSLQFRFDNEDILLERAQEKPFFGWGGRNRSRVFDARGRDQSVTDGTWIIIIGQRGWVGYLTFFGLLCLPPILLFLRSKQLAINAGTAGLVLVLTANLIDLVPNSGLVPLTWLIAGALAGRYELGGVPAAQNQNQNQTQTRRGGLRNRSGPSRDRDRAVPARRLRPVARG